SAVASLDLPLRTSPIACFAASKSGVIDFTAGSVAAGRSVGGRSLGNGMGSTTACAPPRRCAAFRSLSDVEPCLGFLFSTFVLLCADTCFLPAAASAPAGPGATPAAPSSQRKTHRRARDGARRCCPPACAFARRPRAAANHRSRNLRSSFGPKLLMILVLPTTTG